MSGYSANPAGGYPISGYPALGGPRHPSVSSNPAGAAPREAELDTSRASQVRDSRASQMRHPEPHR